MFVCVCVRACVYMFVWYVCARARVFACVCLCVCVRARVRTYVRTCVVCVHMGAHVCFFIPENNVFYVTDQCCIKVIILNRVGLILAACHVLMRASLTINVINFFVVI